MGAGSARKWGRTPRFSCAFSSGTRFRAAAVGRGGENGSGWLELKGGRALNWDWMGDDVCRTKGASASLAGSTIESEPISIISGMVAAARVGRRTKRLDRNEVGSSCELDTVGWDAVRRSKPARSEVAAARDAAGAQVDVEASVVVVGAAVDPDLCCR